MAKKFTSGMFIRLNTKDRKKLDKILESENYDSIAQFVRTKIREEVIK